MVRDPHVGSQGYKFGIFVGKSLASQCYYHVKHIDFLFMTELDKLTNYSLRCSENVYENLKGLPELTFSNSRKISIIYLP